MDLFSFFNAQVSVNQSKNRSEIITTASSDCPGEHTDQSITGVTIDLSDVGENCNIGSISIGNRAEIDFHCTINNLITETAKMVSEAVSEQERSGGPAVSMFGVQASIDQSENESVITNAINNRCNTDNLKQQDISDVLIDTGSGCPHEGIEILNELDVKTACKIGTLVETIVEQESSAKSSQVMKSSPVAIAFAIACLLFCCCGFCCIFFIGMTSKKKVPVNNPGTFQSGWAPS